MYKEGDYIIGKGVVDTNHCGLPWVTGLYGSFNGVLQIKDMDGLLIDAQTGIQLLDSELRIRLNNPEFDYENKLSDCINWRKKNQPCVPCINYTPSIFKRLLRWLIT